MRRNSKEKKKRVVLNKWTEEPDVNQNTKASTTASVMSTLAVSDTARSRLSFKKMTKAEEPSASSTDVDDTAQERRDRRWEMTELQTIWDKHLQLMREFTEAKIVQAKWDRYMRCDGSPDPVNQREINTYISLRQEDTTRDDADSVFEDSQMDLQLIQELECLLVNSPSDLMSEEEKHAHQQTIDELRRLIMCKLDMATLQVMREATYLAHKETGNLQYAASIQDIDLCIWGNIMKNPRIRIFEFENFNYSFDIPKTLALTDCAVRILTTAFDNYSPSSKTMAPRLKKAEVELEPSVELEPIEEQKESDEKEPETANKENGEESSEDPSSLIKLSMAVTSESSAGTPQPTEEEVQEVIEEDYPDPPTPEPAEFDDFGEEEDVIDLRAYRVLGRIYHINLLQLPPQPRVAGAWTITQMVDPPVINFLEYVADTTGGPDVGKDGRKDENPPITVNIILPADVISLDQPSVAHWDAQRKLWSTTGISDTSYAEDTRTVTFKSNHFGTICLLQDKHMNLPFTSWLLRPHSLNSAVFSITSPFIEIEIEIKEDLCCLSGPNNRPELEAIRDKWVTPSELIKMMKKSGLDFFPSEDSMKFVNVQRKNPVTEELMYQQMALTASAVAFSWSKWNQQGTDFNEITFSVAERLTDEPVPEDAWWTLMATKHRVTKISAEVEELSVSGGLREKSEIYSLKDEESGMVHLSANPSKVPPVRRTPGAKAQRRSRQKDEIKTPREQFLESFNFQKPPFKSNIYHLLMSSGDEALRSRISNTSFLFVSCVHKLLSTTRVLNYA